MTEIYLVGVLGEGPLFEGKAISFNSPPQQTKEVCPYCFLYPEFDCPICKEK